MRCQVAVQVTESGVQVWRQCTGECDGDTWDRYKKNNAGKVKKGSDGKRCVDTTVHNFAFVPQNGSRPKHDYWLETLKARKGASGGGTQETVNA